MLEENLFEFEKYITKKLKEIENESERRDAKEVLWDGLARLFLYTEKKYQDLEERILNELPRFLNQYAIYSAMINKDLYDSINDYWFPICINNNFQKKITIFFKGNDTLNDIFSNHKGFRCSINKSNEEFMLHIKKDESYIKKLKEIYQMFKCNMIAWNTVHMGHLERLYVISADGYEGDLKLEDITVEWEGLEKYIVWNVIPVWNIEPIEFRSSEYMIPGIDGRYYEHCITLPSMAKKDGFLLGVNQDIINIRREEGKIFLKTKKEEMGIYGGLRIHQKTEMNNFMIVDDILTNAKQESFALRYQYETGNFIQTRMELRRRIVAIAGNDCGVTDEVEIVNYEERNFIVGDMNFFITEPVFPIDNRKFIVLHYVKPMDCSYLFEANLRYLLSQLQLEYMEYRCIAIED